MFAGHYTPLALSYLVGLGGWLLAARLLPGVWPPETVSPFPHPWRELGIALAGGVGVVAMGQLWSAGIRLPEDGAAGPLLGTINQAFIFAPILAVPAWRRQPWSSAWLPSSRIATRLLVGLAISTLAVGAYSLLRQGADPPWILLGRIWRYDRIDEMAQVLFEDLTIAILFVRLAGAIGGSRATVGVACLFAAGHVPAMLSGGATGPELAGLVRDAALGVAVILVLRRSRDVLWFWCLHFCLDLTQFAGVTGVR